MNVLNNVLKIFQTKIRFTACHAKNWIAQNHFGTVKFVYKHVLKHSIVIIFARLAKNSTTLSGMEKHAFRRRFAESMKTMFQNRILANALKAITRKSQSA